MTATTTRRSAIELRKVCRGARSFASPLSGRARHPRSQGGGLSRRSGPVPVWATQWPVRAGEPSCVDSAGFEPAIAAYCRRSPMLSYRTRAGRLHLRAHGHPPPPTVSVRTLSHRPSLGRQREVFGQTDAAQPRVYPEESAGSAGAATAVRGESDRPPFATVAVLPSTLVMGGGHQLRAAPPPPPCRAGVRSALLDPFFHFF